MCLVNYSLSYWTFKLLFSKPLTKCCRLWWHNLGSNYIRSRTSGVGWNRGGIVMHARRYNSRDKQCSMSGWQSTNNRWEGSTLQKSRFVPYDNWQSQAMLETLKYQAHAQKAMLLTLGLHEALLDICEATETMFNPDLCS